jgi:hypothetical protein
MTFLREADIAFRDSAIIDAFGRARVSCPVTLFDSKLLYDKSTLLWDEETFGGATSTHSTANAAVSMSTTSSGDAVIRQTYMRFLYQPGKSSQVLMTFQASEDTNVRKRIGCFETSNVADSVPQNGVYFEVDGSTVSWNIAKNGTVTETEAQGDWNVDPLDGTGPSGITLDLDGTQIIVIDYEWLGVGRVRVGFVIDGFIYYVHYFNHANDSSFTSVYMSTPNLPLCYSIYQDGAGSGTLDHICCTYLSEGGQEDLGIIRSQKTGFTDIDANTPGTFYALIGLRLKTTHLDAVIKIINFTVLLTTSDDLIWELRLNPTVANSPTFTGETNSAVEIATGSTGTNPSNTTVTGGTTIASGYVTGETDFNGDINTAIRPGAAIDGTRDEIWLITSPVETTNQDVFASLTWRELI